jgi:hypothetical protein
MGNIKIHLGFGMTTILLNAQYWHSQTQNFVDKITEHQENTQNRRHIDPNAHAASVCSAYRSGTRTLAAILNDTGLRATVPRINVLHYLNTTDMPVTEMTSRCVAASIDCVQNAHRTRN